ncbi:acyl carrier protein [Hyphomicrobium sp.]|uniref:acyl carrier protein n=1 Tax=Hyphomicrobium sp. TaxID=82 RepID=UPI002E2FA267|nr:phosphopantetheine-binding protein [Hyphomicrobium sp.]HEX2841885.1 phosphopantetheine-binding protein [Hyphomicrobium sp.]
MNANEKIRAFIEEQFLVEFDETFTEDADLFREGVMDSFGYVQLHRFIEREFGIKFTETQLTENLLVSCTQICVYVLRAIAQRGATLDAVQNQALRA